MRNRASAKKAGTDYENLITNGFREALNDETIHRAPRWGAKDKGDVVNVRFNGHLLVVQCKDCVTLSLPRWIKEAKEQAKNAGALIGIVAHKRHGSRDFKKQWFTMTGAEVIALMTGIPPED